MKNVNMLIGIHGRRHSGKDTVARMLRHYMPGGQTFAFATHLKNICYLTYGLTYEQLNDPRRKEEVNPMWGVKNRELMTMTADDLKKRWGNDFFVRAFERALVNHMDIFKRPFIVTDVRHQEEADAIRKAGGTILHLRRPETDATAGDHISEKWLAGGPDEIWIANVGDRDELLRNVRNFIIHRFGSDALDKHPYTGGGDRF